MIEIIQQRLDDYRTDSPQRQEQSLKEILQEITLWSLWRAGFFGIAAFQGGTSLRILHGLPRFSEDLDFILRVPDIRFAWNEYLAPFREGLLEFGIRPTVRDRSSMEQAVRRAVIKDDSFARQLDLSFVRPPNQPRITIKLEVDTRPPGHSEFDWSYLDFPVDFEVCHQDLPSNFALKIHALLCRPYLKGRDWYDFGWYVSRGVRPNLAHLSAALDQQGPWAGRGIDVNVPKLTEFMINRIRSIDWADARRDVEPFLGARERESLALWSERFFIAKLKQLPD